MEKRYRLKIGDTITDASDPNNSYTVESEWVDVQDPWDLPVDEDPK